MYNIKGKILILIKFIYFQQGTNKREILGEVWSFLARIIIKGETFSAMKSVTKFEICSPKYLIRVTHCRGVARISQMNTEEVSLTLSN